MKDREYNNVAKNIKMLLSKLRDYQKIKMIPDLFFNCDNEIIYANEEKTAIGNKKIFSEYKETEVNILTQTQ